MGLASRALHGRLQPRPLLVPAGVFGLQFLIDGLAFGLDRGGPVGVLALARVGRSLSLVDGLSPALALPLRGSLRLGAVPVASLLIAFVRSRSLPLRRGIDGPANALRGLSSRCFAGRSGRLAAVTKVRWADRDAR